MQKGLRLTCIEQTNVGRVELIASSYLIAEIRSLPYKIPPQYGVTIGDAERLADMVMNFATILDNIPHLYLHPIDPADSEYVNLALAADAKLIVSRDKHLLNLMNVKRSDGRQFRKLFPQLMITTPDAFAKQLRQEEREDQR